MSPVEQLRLFRSSPPVASREPAPPAPPSPPPPPAPARAPSRPGEVVDRERRLLEHVIAEPDGRSWLTVVIIACREEPGADLEDVLRGALRDGWALPKYLPARRARDAAFWELARATAWRTSEIAKVWGISRSVVDDGISRHTARMNARAAAENRVPRTAG